MSRGTDTRVCSRALLPTLLLPGKHLHHDGSKDRRTNCNAAVAAAGCELVPPPLLLLLLRAMPPHAGRRAICVTCPLPLAPLLAQLD